MSDPLHTIALIGFKHVGKSTLGYALANRLKLDFTDLDRVIETHYHHSQGEGLTCRQIVRKHGIDYFRTLESGCLKTVLYEKPAVLAVGGGTPITPDNQAEIARCRVVHISAPKGMVFERIMINGRPAFFPEEEEAYEAFTRIWKERAPVYQQLAHAHIENTGTIDEGVHRIMLALQQVGIS